MKSYTFKVSVEEDITERGERAFHAYCPALKGCHTWGHSYDEALANIREANRSFYVVAAQALCELG